MMVVVSPKAPTKELNKTTVASTPAATLSYGTSTVTRAQPAASEYSDWASPLNPGESAKERPSRTYHIINQAPITHCTP
jgi:hypothetical protein